MPACFLASGWKPFAPSWSFVAVAAVGAWPGALGLQPSDPAHASPPGLAEASSAWVGSSLLSALDLGALRGQSDLHPGLEPSGWGRRTRAGPDAGGLSSGSGGQAVAVPYLDLQLYRGAHLS